MQISSHSSARAGFLFSGGVAVNEWRTKPGRLQVARLSLNVLAAAAVGLTGCHYDARADALAGAPVSDRPINVAVVRVRPAITEVSLVLLSDVVARRRALLRARVGGYVERMVVDIGERVRRGQALALIATPEIENDVASRQADHAEKQRRAGRLARLREKGIVSQQDVDRARADEEMASSELARVASVKGYSVVRAPFNGTITARYADEGDLAGMTGEGSALFEVSDLSSVRVRVQVPEAQAHLVQVGMPVAITDGAGVNLAHVSLDRVSRRLDADSRTMLAEAIVPNGAEVLYPGEVVRAVVRIPVLPHLTVPPEALMLRDGTAKVAIVRDDKVFLVNVTTGVHYGTSVEVLSGLSEGDLVAVHVGDSVREGVRVLVSLL
jgi:membrane fusion protein (multidrug efflux system)